MEQDKPSKVRNTKTPQHALNVSVFEVLKLDTGKRRQIKSEEHPNTPAHTNSVNLRSVEIGHCMEQDEPSKVRNTKIPQHALKVSVFEVLKLDTVWNKTTPQR